jgi:hypothetical protein
VALSFVAEGLSPSGGVRLQWTESGGFAAAGRPSRNGEAVPLPIEPKASLADRIEMAREGGRFVGFPVGLAMPF